MPPFNLREELQKLAQRVVPGRRIEIGGQTPTVVSVIKPGETAQTLQDRLGIGNIQFQQAQQAVKQGVGAFVPSAKPLTLGAGGVPVQTGVQPLPTGQQPISAQPSPLTVTPQQLQQRPVSTVKPSAGIVTVGAGQPLTPTTAVQGIQAQIAQQPTPQVQDLQKQIDETKAKLKETQQLKELADKGFTITAPSEKPAEPTGFEKYAETIRDAVKPVIDAYKGYIDELRARPSVAAEFQRLLTEKGLPQFSASLKDIMAKAQGVEAQLEALPEDTKRRVQDFVVTQRQYERVTSAEAKPLTALYNALSRTYEAGTAEYNRGLLEIQTYMGLLDKDTEMKMKALEVGLGAAKFGAEAEAGLAEAGFKAEAEIAKEAAKLPERELEMEKTRAEIEKLRRPEEVKTTSDITNYEYAKRQGFAGTFEQWQATGKPGSILTQTQQNKFAIAGVPNNIALHIQTNLNQGATVQELKNGLAKDLGDANLASQYVDKFMETAQKSSADDLMGLLQQLSNL